MIRKYYQIEHFFFINLIPISRNLDSSLKYGFIYFQIRGFYRGLSWPLCSFGIVNSVFFGVYGNTLKFLESDKSKRKSNYLNIYLSGCVGGAVQLMFVVPVDYIKTALQSQIPHQTAAARGKLFGGTIGIREKSL